MADNAASGLGCGSSSAQERVSRTDSGKAGTMLRKVLALTIFIGLCATAPAVASTLESVRAEGVVKCGVNASLPGFGAEDEAGNWSGFDVDYCRAIAAAIFGDPSKVAFVATTASDRFRQLQSGAIDVLIRNTTWTMSRDTSLNLAFAGVNYYDGQGFMVRRSLGVTSALELSKATVCVQTDTTTELNLADYFQTRGMQYTLVSRPTVEEATAAYSREECTAYTADVTALYAIRLTMTNPQDHLVLPQIISKEPLGPTVRQGDEQWLNIVKWTHFALLNAEEHGVTSANVDQMRNSSNANVRRLLGVEGEFGKALGLSEDWAYNVIKHLGNYGEVFDRNLGFGSRFGIARGLNAPWVDGGLQYAPPVR
jgi:general L-amino acid transport system substrate-binding protein